MSVVNFNFNISKNLKNNKKQKLCLKTLMFNIILGTHWFCISWIVKALFPTPPAAQQKRLTLAEVYVYILNDYISTEIFIIIT